MLSWVESGSAVLEKIGFFSLQCIFTILIPLIPLVKGPSNHVEIGPVAL